MPEVCPVCTTAMEHAPEYRDHACPNCGLCAPLGTLALVRKRLCPGEVRKAFDRLLAQLAVERDVWSATLKDPGEYAVRDAIRRVKRVRDELLKGVGDG